MGLFNKKTDPISERARKLSEEIAALEAQIRKLDSKSAPANSSAASASAPRLRSTALPHGAAAHAPAAPSPPPAPVPHEPIFEEVDQKRLKAEEDAEKDGHYNDLGVRKYDLAAFIQRLKNNFRGPSTANPKLVNYLAAGSIQGLRPMRYEKRVHRNRLVFMVVLILAIMLGIFAIVRRHG
jgi:hypothetical protein